MARPFRYTFILVLFAAGTTLAAVGGWRYARASAPVNGPILLVSIGTLMAFIIVCAGVWVMRRKRPDVHRPFKTPLVPLVPILGIGISTGLMLSLPWSTWLRLIVWLVLGMGIYLGYGRGHSRLRKVAPGGGRGAASKTAGSSLRSE